ncbi:MAG: hypothetical protein ACE5F3_09095 [Mariprofundaceae bacterium]
MNRGEIRSMARTWLNEATAGFFSDAELNSFINVSNQKLNRTIISYDPNVFTVSSTFSTVAGTKAYTLPADFQKMVRLESYLASDPNDIIKLDEITFPRIEGGGIWPVSENGKPSRYFIRSNQMEFIPIPDAVYTLRIYYDNAKPDLNLDTDIPASPTDFHYLIAMQTAILAVPKNQGDYADNLARMYSEGKESLMESLMGRDGDDPEMVEEYLGGMF